MPWSWAARARFLATVLAVATLSVTSSCGFKSGGLAQDDPLCSGADCGATDSAFDGLVDDTDAPVEDTPVPPGTTIEGDFVGAVVSGNAAGVELHGSMHWSSAVRGSAAGITLEGTLE